MIDHDALMEMLTRLKLTAVRDQLDTLLDEAARREMTLREALGFLCQREIARKDERRVEMAGKIAHFPTVRDQTGSVLFVAAPALVAALAKGHAEGRLDERLAFYAKPKLLIIDELGYLPFEPNAAHLFFGEKQSSSGAARSSPTASDRPPTICQRSPILDRRPARLA